MLACGNSWLECSAVPGLRRRCREHRREGASVGPITRFQPDALQPLGDLNFNAMDQVLQGQWHQSEPMGNDWLLRWRSGS